MRHSHDYEVTERRGKVVICKCSCGAKQTLLIKHFSAERAALIDEIIKNAEKPEKKG